MKKLNNFIENFIYWKMQGYSWRQAWYLARRTF